MYIYLRTYIWDCLESTNTGKLDARRKIFLLRSLIKVSLNCHSQNHCFGTEEDTREKGKLYKPQSKISELVDNRSSAEQAQEYARLLGSNERKLDRLGKKKKEGEKRKSNLELFKEELKMIQEEREERHKYKGVVKTVISSAQSEDPMMAALKCVEGMCIKYIAKSHLQT